MQFSILLLTVLGIFITAHASHVDTKVREQKKRKLIWIAAVITALVAISQYALSWRDSYNHNKEIKEASDRHTALIAQLGKEIEDANNRHAALLSQNEKLRSQIDNLAPFIQMVMEEYGKVDKQAISKLTDNIRTILHPEVVRLTNRDKQNFNEETGKYKTSYYFRSHYPSTVYGVLIYLKFDTPLLEARMSIEGACLMVIQKKDISLQMLPNNRVILTAEVLPESARIKVVVTTKEKPTLAAFACCPPERNRKTIRSLLKDIVANKPK